MFNVLFIHDLKPNEADLCHLLVKQGFPTPKYFESTKLILNLFQFVINCIQMCYFFASNLIYALSDKEDCSRYVKVIAKTMLGKLIRGQLQFEWHYYDSVEKSQRHIFKLKFSPSKPGYWVRPIS